MNKNLSLFSKRFPALADMLQKDLTSYEQGNPEPMTLLNAKNGSLTATENNMALHSKYNPEREAVQFISRFSEEQHQAVVFLSFGLGYAPIEFARTHLSVPMIIAEPDSSYIFQAMTVLDWTPVLEHENLIFAVNAPVDVMRSILGQYKSSSVCILSTPSQTAHCQEYAQAVKEILRQNSQKETINTNTLEKFSHLWLSNSCRNLNLIDTLDGIQKFAGLNAKLSRRLPFTILAAGPSLSTIIPHLKEIHEKSITVCVDTALHSCLASGVEPDFIILVDPQYACAMHLEFLSSPHSVLVTESAAWPSVFRFECRETVLCSSMFPIGQYFEKKLGYKGKLGAGGSVTTTAWDFARVCGATEIYIAGMDLGFPGRQTHIRGSQFEEREHRTSSRLNPSETQSTAALMSASPSYEKDYNGKKLLTDKKMKLFSWWFQTNCQQAEQAGVMTYSLTKESLAINNIHPASLESILSLPDASAQKKQFYDLAAKESENIRKNRPNISFKTVYEEFKSNLQDLENLARKGLGLCDKAIKNRLKAQEVFSELSAIDTKIMSSDEKDAASLVFPTERKIKELTQNLPEEPVLKSLYYSRIIYSELIKAIQEYLRNL